MIYECHKCHDQQLSHCPLKPITMITTTMTTMRFHGSLVLYLLSLLLPAVVSEILPFSLLMEPASEYIHYVEGFLVAPGYIDLSRLRFVTVETGEFVTDDVEFDKEDHDDDSIEGDDGPDRRILNEDGKGGSTLDVAVFNLPSDCITSKNGCDWIGLGVGARTDDGVVRYCCSNDAIDLGLCTETALGRLILDGDAFAGKHRFIDVPATGISEQFLKYGKFEEKEGTSGKYAILFANCNDAGRPVIVEGEMEWKSKHGYLPGDLFPYMNFYAVIFCVYFVLILWYGISMKMFEDGNIPIQGWIFGTIAIGCLEMFFKTGDMFIWNEEGSRFWAAVYIGKIVGVLKQGISRCLLVMVSLGWGVIRDDLGPVMNRINFLGGLYIAVAMVLEIMKEVATAEIKKMSQEEEEELFDVVSILSLVVALIDVIFYLWVIDSLNATMEYLEGLNQTSKLLRYLRLRMILLLSILFSVVVAVFGIVDAYDQGIVDDDMEWVVDAAIEANYIFVLCGVAVLWRPQKNAKEYAYVMQLPSAKADDEQDGEEGEFEMANVVPSAADSDDDDDGDGGDSFSDEPTTK